MRDKSDSLARLAAAMAKAQAEMRNATKDATNPHFNRKYADLASVWDACREPLTKHGLSVIQMPGFENGQITVTTVLLHESGEYIASVSGIPFEEERGRNKAQSVGSAVTYLRRYALAAVASVCPEDDDGNAVASAPKAAKKPEAPTPTDKRVPLSETQRGWFYKKASGDLDLVHRAVAAVTGKPCSKEAWPLITASEHAKISEKVDELVEERRLVATTP